MKLNTIENVIAAAKRANTSTSLDRLRRIENCLHCYPSNAEADSLIPRIETLIRYKSIGR